MYKLILSIALIITCQLSAFHFAIIKHWDGEEYSKNALLQEHWAERFFFNRYQFRGDEVVLDIGSGDGKLTARIASNLPYGTCSGFDMSASMLETAVKNHQDKKNLSFFLHNAEDLTFYEHNKNKYDLVVSFTVLHWVKNQSAALKGIHDVLKPGGKFFLRLCSKSDDPIQEIADKLTKSEKYKEHFEFFLDPMSRFSESEYAALLKAADLSVISIRDVEESDELIGRDSLVKQLKSWLPHYHFLKQLNPQLSEIYMDEIVDTYLAKYPMTSNETIILYDHYLEVIGKK